MLDFDLARQQLLDTHSCALTSANLSLAEAANRILAAPLAARGVKVGVLMGSAYLFTREIVASGSIVQQFQREVLECERTINLESGPGHASRCAYTPFAEEYMKKRKELREQQVPGDEARLEVARESLDIYAPLANRLGIWQLKWELEDLSFRFIEPDTYKRIAKMLDERRTEREQFIQDAIDRLRSELAAVGVEADITGRAKHIYSIYNKMRQKRLDFSQVYDIRALRVLVHEVKDCYTVLGFVHQMWHPIAKEFDDYISKPKGNNYQSLHTAVLAGDGRALEVQIRTHGMHKHAELGVAAHWRYKEGGGAPNTAYDEKIALLRSIPVEGAPGSASRSWLIL